MIPDKHFKIWFLIWLVLYLELLFFGEQGNPFIRNYSPQETGGHPVNLSIVQDHRGLIYVGNAQGVLEFDGKTWNHIIEAGNGTYVRAIVSDHGGRIYLGGFSELGQIVYSSQGKADYRSFKALLPEKERDCGDIFDVLYGSQGIYFVSRKNVFFWDYEYLTVMDFQTEHLGLSAYGYVFLSRTNPNGIYLLIGNHSIRLPQTEKLVKSDKTQIYLLPYENNQLLVIAMGTGIFVYDLKQALFSIMPFFSAIISESAVLFYELKTEIYQYLQTNIFKSMALIDNNIYAFGTQKGGIVMMDKTGQLIRIINQQRGLQSNDIWKLYLDREKNLWAALSSGVAYIEINSPLTMFNQLNNLNGIVLNCIKHNNRLYVGTYDGIHCLADYQWQLSADREHFIPVKNTQDACFDFHISKGRLLALGNRKVFYIENDQAFLLQNINGFPFCLGASPLWPDHLLIGKENGVEVLKLNYPISPTSIANNSSPLSAEMAQWKNLNAISGSIRRIDTDVRGNVWLSDIYSGLWYIKIKEDSPEQFTVLHFTEKQGLPSAYYNYAYVLENEILIATDHGIYQTLGSKNDDPQTIHFRPFEFFKGCKLDQSFACRHLIIDQQKRFFLTIGDRINMGIPHSDGYYQWFDAPFNKIKGLVENLFLEQDRFLWCCGVDSRSLFRFDTLKEKNYKSMYSALIRKISVGKNQEVIFYGNNFLPGSLQDNYSEYSTLIQPESLKGIFAYRDNAIRFEFGASFFEHTDDVLFAYYLQGFDSQWSNWSSDYKKEYSNLPEGGYSFWIKAKNIYHQESQTAAYSFRVRAPWYRTVWSYLGYFLLSIFFIYAVVQLNVRRLKVAKFRLEKIITQRTEEIVQKKEEIEVYAKDLYQANEQLIQAKNALWGEMELAKKIQTVLLPKKPYIPGYDITAYMNPADEVGGDYYDVIEARGILNTAPDSRPLTPETGQTQEFASPGSSTKSSFCPLASNLLPAYWLAIGDVSGHGVPAGLVMMMVQTAIRTALETHGNESPKKILNQINRVIHYNINQLDEDKYVTLTLMKVEMDGAISFSGLHQDILIYRALQKTIETIETQGLWMGIMADVEAFMPVGQLKLESNDVMLLYTDGLTESIDDQVQMFSEIKLQSILLESGNQPAESIKEAILLALQNYTSNDDISFIIVKKQAF